MKTRRLRQLHLQNNKLKCISDRAFDKLKARSQFQKIQKFPQFFKFFENSKFLRNSKVILNLQKASGSSQFGEK